MSTPPSAPAVAPPAFHPLLVTAVDPLGEDAVAVTLAVPPELRATFRHTPGQHLTLRRLAAAGAGAEGAEMRRTYSICSPADDDPATLRIGIRLVEGGAFSPYACKELAPGDTVHALPPAGRFTLAPRPGRYAAIVGGSGITPVLSIAATLLSREPEARFHLVRSDRTTASTMFLEETADLKDRHPDRFHLLNALSREDQQAGLPPGRLDEPRLTALLPALLPVDSVDGWFLCGPYGLVQEAERALRTLGVPRDRVHREIFHAAAVPASAVPDPAAAAPALTATVTATLGGRAGTYSALPGESLLDTVLRNRPDAPYACKGGVCGTCRSRLLTGEVTMDRNFALEPEETDAGYVLACQSHPTTPRVELDFDA
ncbi:2Fe-2S iron-sulfur cluster-binding protein [Streptomyces sp. NPDC060194]|uniref:2Fe-2S iron-sulfur cluster-binding protein n=1 Tax=Streptomyces sp. NPDC060194 TaxID=3347069 RepID=UPI0036694243